jgi:multidrug efflux pump subunit AcrA (membrane-fusion protein)
MNAYSMKACAVKSGLIVGAVWMGLLLLASCGDRGSAKLSAPPEPKFVKTVTAEARGIPVALTASGSLVAFEASNVAPEVEGVVSATPVSVGAYVRQGAVILRLNPAQAKIRFDEAAAAEAQAEAALRQAEAKLGPHTATPEAAADAAAAKASLDVAEADFALTEQEEARAKRLLNTGDVSRSAWDRARATMLGARSRVEEARQRYNAAKNAARQDAGGIAVARAALDGARAQVALARKALGDTVVRAPFAGFVSARPVAVGEYVSPQTKVAGIERVHPLRLLLAMNEADAARVRAGQRVSVRVASYAEREFRGEVMVIHPSANPATRAVTVEAHLANGDTALRPGSFATARIEEGGMLDVAAVPAKAVEEDSRVESRRVWVVVDGRARLRLVEAAGKDSKGEWLIRKGVKPGERVVVGEVKGLYDGAPVRQ